MTNWVKKDRGKDWQQTEKDEGEKAAEVIVRQNSERNKDGNNQEPHCPWYRRVMYRKPFRLLLILNTDNGKGRSKADGGSKGISVAGSQTMSARERSHSIVSGFAGKPVLSSTVPRTMASETSKSSAPGLTPAESGPAPPLAEAFRRVPPP